MKRVKKIICTIRGILFIVIVAGSIGYAIIAPTIEEPVLTTEEFVAQRKAEMVELQQMCDQPGVDCDDDDGEYYYYYDPLD